jgi:phage-related protein
MVNIVKGCQKELDAFPERIREDLADAIARLEAGLTLSMPLSRPMPDIGKGVSELRLRDRSGIYRVFYFMARKGSIYLLHAMKKTTQTTPVKTINLVKKRLAELSL